MNEYLDVDCRGDLFGPAFSGISWQSDLLDITGCKAISGVKGVQYMKGKQYACLRYTVEEGSHRFVAGVLCWDTLTGIVESVAVHPDYRRQKIAQNMLAVCRAFVCKRLKCGDNITKEGRALALACGMLAG